MPESVIIWVIVAVIIASRRHARSERLQHRELEQRLLRYMCFFKVTLSAIHIH